MITQWVNEVEVDPTYVGMIRTAENIDLMAFR